MGVSKNMWALSQPKYEGSIFQRGGKLSESGPIFAANISLGYLLFRFAEHEVAA